MSTSEPSGADDEPRGLVLTRLQGRIAAGAILAAAFVLYLAIAAYANTGLYSRYLADDYCIAAHLNDTGLLAAQSYWYMNWTGRFGYVFLSDLVPFLG